MKFFHKLLGRPLASSESKKEKLSVFTGVPALGLDALASTAYGPEAVLMVLLPLGLAGGHYFSIITGLIVAQLIFLYLSYQQTAAAYPNGGGAYIVAGTNLGKYAGLLAAVALLIDYLLNVAVGISAGVGAIVSAFPLLQPHMLLFCLFILFTLTLLNLRGIRESGLLFILPTVLFVGSMGVVILIGLFKAWHGGGHLQPVITPPIIPPATTHVSIWLLFGAFANGLTAMSGIEAVSNAVPLFRKPTVSNAQRTLTVIVLVLGLFLLALGYLCPAYHIGAMDETKSGYQTILAQLVAAVVGHGIFYYTAIASIFIVLTYSAQTSFVGFPRVCRLLASDDFLPCYFANKGRRLVFSQGIIVLAILSGLLLYVFDGITNKLIPLFAVGAFTAFVLSQAGMVVYWIRKSADVLQKKIWFNALGAITTTIALFIIIISKFVNGAWIVLVVLPIIFLLLNKIKLHYEKIAKEIAKPLVLQVSKLQPPVVIIPIQGWDRLAEKAIRFALLLSDDITAIYVSSEKNSEKSDKLKKIWINNVENPAKNINSAIPQLEIIYSPYRQLYQPILNFVKKVKADKPNRLIAIIIPELVEPHWYEHLLHNIHAAALRALLFMERDECTIVISTPWYLE